MHLSRREFLSMMSAAGFAGAAPGLARGARNSRPLYELAPFGNVTLMHFTDTHAQLLPIHYREPNINIGVGEALGRPPHRVGAALLSHFNIAQGSAQAHALTYLDFERASRRYGKVGGFAHLATLIQRVRVQRPDRTLLLDGGDTWQGSATALWSKAQDMVDACKLLGVDMMTGHWEFTFGAERVKEILRNDFKGNIEFLAQNVNDAAWGDLVFKPYSLREVNGVLVAVIGQAFPYTATANPGHFVPDWSFGIKEEHLQKMVEEVRAKGAKVVVLLSHNGADVDIKLARRVRGIDVILGGHTHDAVPAPFVVASGAGRTLVINSGSNAKFLSVLDLDVKGGRVLGYRFKLLPVFAELLPADPAMAAHIETVRRPYLAQLNQPLAVTESLLYRRGNFNGTFDQIILDALLATLDAEIAFSPGFRWGTTLLPGETITQGNVIDLTAITYPNVTLSHLTGAEIKERLEDVADNLFNQDPYYQTGGDMVRVGGLRYSIDPAQSIGKRIGDLELNGKKLDADKKYRVAGWASMQLQPEGKPVWEIVSAYLKDKKSVRSDAPSNPRVIGAANNPGYAAA